MDEIYKRLLEKEEQFKKSYETAKKYNVISDCQKYEMILNVIEYIKTGKENDK